MSSGLFVGTFYSLGITSIMISLAIHGCCIGCVDKIEAILITENNSNSRDYDKEKLKMMKCLGLIIGSFTGYFLFTFVNLWFVLNIKNLD